MRRLELTRSGLMGTLAVLLVVLVCVRLGLWQLDRRDERRARSRAVAERTAAPPVLLESLPTDTAGLTFRRAVVEGEADDDRALVLAGRSLNGAPGVHMLSPFLMPAGAVLVNRGWLPADDGATADLDPARLGGRYRVQGVLMPFPDVDLDRRADGFQTRWFRVDGDAIRAQYPYAVAPLYLRATVRPVPVPGGTGVAPPPAPDPDQGGPVVLDAPTLDAGPHLSYAIQWFSFAAIFAGGWLVLLVRRERPEGPG